MTLTGGGKVSLSSSGNNFIADGGSPETLTNVNNTISGAGTIGDSDFTLVNSSTIDANISGGTLTIKTGANLITNAGLLEANGQVTDLAISGSLTNLGTVEAFVTRRATLPLLAYPLAAVRSRIPTPWSHRRSII